MLQLSPLSLVQSAGLNSKLVAFHFLPFIIFYFTLLGDLIAALEYFNHAPIKRISLKKYS